MARCIFCNEWAGRDSDRHERCALEFARQMEQPSLLRRLLAASRHAARTVYAIFSGAVARPR
jgi:hypothetical protein